MAASEGAFLNLYPSNPGLGGDGCWEGATVSPSTGLLGFLGGVWKPRTRSALCPSWAAGGQEAVAGQAAWKGFHEMVRAFRVLLF